MNVRDPLIEIAEAFLTGVYPMRPPTRRPRSIPPRRRPDRPRVEVLEARQLLATLTVLNTDDGGSGSLRQAILDSNASVGVADTIVFAIPGLGAHTIAPASALPTITDPVVIDGTTQPTSVSGLAIEIDGAGAGAGADGLVITAGGSTVRGLVINRFQGHGSGVNAGGLGIILSGPGGNRIVGDFLGTDPHGHDHRPRRHRRQCRRPGQSERRLAHRRLAPQYDRRDDRLRSQRRLRQRRLRLRLGGLRHDLPDSRRRDRRRRGDGQHHRG